MLEWLGTEQEDGSMQWYVRLVDPLDTKRLVGGLSIQTCVKCCALVPEDMMPAHRAWHNPMDQS